MNSSSGIKSEKSLLNQKDSLSPWFQFKLSFLYLKQSPPDLWLMFLIKILGYSAFSVLNIGSSIYFTEVLSFSDIQMGLIFAFQGVLGGAYSLTLGTFPDRYGIRFSLIFANLSLFLCFLLLVCIDNRYAQVTSISLLLTASQSVSVPTTKLCVKKYTSDQCRSLAYSLYYIILFGSSAIAGVVTDIVLTYGNEDMTTFRYTFIYGMCAVAVSVFLTCFLRNLDFSASGTTTVSVERPRTYLLEDTRGILVLKSFWRFFALAILFIFIRAIYSHIGITLPLFMYRDIQQGAHFGYIIALHEVLTVLCTPFLTMLIYKLSFYSLFVIGSVFCAISPIVFIFGSNYTAVLVFVMWASVGEAIHAPRLLDYTVEIAPKARIGLFLSIAAIPLSLSSIVAGLMAGVLLEEYCPEEGKRECWKMWGVICMLACVSCAIMVFCRKFIEEPAYESDPYVSCSRESRSMIIREY